MDNLENSNESSNESIPENTGFSSIITKNTTIISLIVLCIVIILAITLYTSSTKSNIPNNQQSQDKLTALNEAFRSFLGPRWPYVLLVFTILLGGFIGLLYIATQKGILSINIDEKNAKILNISFIVFLILFTITMIILAIKEYRNYKNRQANGDIPNYTPSINTQKQTQQILTIIGLVLLIIGGGVFGLWFYKRNKV